MKKSGKRCIAVAVMAFLLVNLTPFPLKTSAYDEDRIYLNSTFENITPGEAPRNWTITSGETTKVEFSGEGVPEPDTDVVRNRVEVLENKCGNQYSRITVNTNLQAYISKNLVLLKQGGKYVFEVDIRADDAVTEKYITFRDTNKITANMIRFLPSGTIVTHNGDAIMKFTEGTWYRIALLVDFDNDTYSVYINGKKKAFEVPLNGMVDIQQLRIGVKKSPDGEKSAMGIDNVKLYKSSEFKDAEFFPEEYVSVNGNSVVGEKPFLERMKNTLAFYENRNIALIDGYQHQLDEENEQVKVFVKDSELYIPVRFTVENLGGEVLWDEANGARIIIDGKETPMPESVVYSEARSFLPIYELAEIVGKEVFYNNDYLAVLSDKKDFYDLSVDGAFMYKAVRKLAFDNPTGEEVIAALKERNPNNQHPRLLVRPGEFEALKEKVKTDPLMSKWLAASKKKAEVWFGAELLKYESNNNTNILSVSRSAMDRIQLLAFLYNVTGEVRYAQRAWQEIEAVCNFPDWNHYHMLDVAEMTAAVALGYDWLYDYLNEEQKVLMRKAIAQFGLEQGLDDYLDLPRVRSNRWIVPDMATNWNAVCNGGLALGALAIGDDAGYEELAGQVLEHGLESVKDILKVYCPDGCGKEGISYWRYATVYLAYMFDALETAVGTDYGRFNVPGMKQTAYYSLNAVGPVNTFKFSDAPDNITNSPELFWLASKAGDSTIGAERLRQMERFDMVPLAIDYLWYDSETCNSEDTATLDTFFYTEMSLAFFRNSWEDSNAIYLGMKAGRNDLAHGHRDIGVFEVQALGERWVYDLGKEDYNLGYPNEHLYRIRPEGHNTFVINPRYESEQFVNSANPITKYASKDSEGFAIADLSEAYVVDVSSAKRGVSLFNNRSMVAVRDEITMRKPSEVYWFMHTKADIEIDGDTAIFSMNGKKMVVKIIANHTPTLTVMDAVPLPSSPVVPTQNPNEGVRKLAVHFDDIEDLELTAILIPMYDSDPIPEEFPEILPLNEWSEETGICK